MAGELLLVTGPPGAGKTAVCEVLRAGRTLVTGDDFADGGFDVVFDGVVGPWFVPTFLASVARACCA